MNHLDHTDPGESRKVYNLHVHTNAPANPGDPDVIFLWDHVFVTDSPYEVYYYHNDYLVSVRRISDQNGNLVWSRDYYPFGEERIATGADEDNTYAFTGHERDRETGTDNLWHRHRDWRLGRFTQTDPFYRLFPDLSPYQYCYNNPLRYIDPFGLDPKPVFDEEGNFLYILMDEITVEADRITSNRGIEFIANHESFRREVYYDLAGYATIGYGFKLSPEEAQHWLEKEMSETEAKKMLIKKIQEFERSVRNAIVVDLTQNQFDALVSLTYNIGGTGLRQSGLPNLININPSSPDVVKTWLSMIKAGGIPSQGLLNRREDEIKRYLNGVY